jgi:hypothetical protein
MLTEKAVAKVDDSAPDAGITSGLYSQIAFGVEAHGAIGQVG